MRTIAFLALVAAVVASATALPVDAEESAAPAFLKIAPAGYRDWKLISVAREEAPLDDIRAVLGNDIALRAYRTHATTFPEGTIIARVAWSFEPSEDDNAAFGRPQSFVAGAPKNGVQFMIKDSKKYAATGGWGYGQFNDSKAVDDSMLATCFPCHRAIKNRDYVFTRYAP